MDPIHISSGYQPQVYVNNRPYQFFGGTSYLGLNYNQAYLQLFKAGLDYWGLNNGASRNNNIRLSIYEETEQLLAANYETEAALTFSSGWLSAQVAVSTLSKNRTLIYLNDVHPALMVTDAEIFKISDVIDHINLSPQSDFLIVSNSVNNIIPKVYDFSVFNEILSSKNIILLLDHSHGFGVLEKEWRNAVNFSASNLKTVYCGSLAKGLSLDAGVILGDQYLIDELKITATYNGASPCSPATLYTYLHGSEIIKKARMKLMDNLKYFTAHLSKEDFFWIDNFPIIQILNPKIVEKLQESEILYTAFPYPNASSPLLHRLIISANHSLEDLKSLLKVI